MAKRIILLRHGQSVWNLENRFTGWTDVDLSDNGRAEAAHAADLLKAAGLFPDISFTSYLRRAIHTLQIVMARLERDWVPAIRDWHLNERHYGALQGLNKAETAREYGEATVHEWRRGFDDTPPLLTPDDPRWPGNDSRYDSLSADELPLAESLQDTIARVRCCWEERIVPATRDHETVLIAAHGNSLRGLAMMMCHFTAAEIVDVEIPTGRPWVFEIDGRMNVLSSRYL